jgi:hypothetical protein
MNKMLNPKHQYFYTIQCNIAAEIDCPEQRIRTGNFLDALMQAIKPMMENGKGGIIRIQPAGETEDTIITIEPENHALGKE